MTKWSGTSYTVGGGGKALDIPGERLSLSRPGERLSHIRGSSEGAAVFGTGTPRELVKRSASARPAGSVPPVAGGFSGSFVLGKPRPRESLKGRLFGVPLEELITNPVRCVSRQILLPTVRCTSGLFVSECVCMRLCVLGDVWREGRGLRVVRGDAFIGSWVFSHVVGEAL